MNRWVHSAFGFVAILMAILLIIFGWSSGPPHGLHMSMLSVPWLGLALLASITGRTVREQADRIAALERRLEARPTAESTLS